MDAEVPREAGLNDRLQKIRSRKRVIGTSCNTSWQTHRTSSRIFWCADSSNRQGFSCKVLSINANKKATGPSDRPKLFSSQYLPICSIDLTGDGKLGYGFTSADELEEVDISPGDKPRPTFISKKLNPDSREPMIALLKEYSDCFAWDYTKMPRLDRSIVEHRLPLKKGFRSFQQRARQ